MAQGAASAAGPAAAPSGRGGSVPDITAAPASVTLDITIEVLAHP
jgi:hypothetical protein